MSVDAIFFTPEVKVSDDSIFEGILFSQEEIELISKNCFSKFKKNPNELQIFLQLNNNKIIRTAFVFQVQPYQKIYSNFVVHVEPAVNGKANKKIVDMLKYIKDVLKNRNISIMSFAFDGDSAYSQMHEEYFNSYINSALTKNSISLTKTLNFRVISDFLHLIKRLRYRIFGVFIHSGFELSGKFFNVETLKNLFKNLPNIIWSNESYTKMHDSLPLLLFSPQNFLFLLEKKQFLEAAYFLPISFSILALNFPNLGFKNRHYFLNIAFWFLAYYYDEKNKKDKKQLSDTKRGGEHITFYSNKIVIEFLNTIHCNIQLMNIFEFFYFDRNSTTPLEHKFGCSRKRAKFIHTLKKFLKVISEMQTIQQKEALQKGENFEEELEKIHCRQNSFEVTCESKFCDSAFTFIEEDYPAQAVAKAFLELAGFDVKSDISPYDIVSHLIAYLSIFIDDSQNEGRRRTKISHRIFTCGVGQCTNGKLLTTSSVKKYKFTKLNYDDHKELLDMKLRVKFSIPKNVKITKDKYFYIIDVLKRRNILEEELPSKNSSKKEMINWLVSNLNRIYTIILDL